MDDVCILKMVLGFPAQPNLFLVLLLLRGSETLPATTADAKRTERQDRNTQVVKSKPRAKVADTLYSRMFAWK